MFMEPLGLFCPVGECDNFLFVERTLRFLICFHALRCSSKTTTLNSNTIIEESRNGTKKTLLQSLLIIGRQWKAGESDIETKPSNGSAQVEPDVVRKGNFEMDEHQRTVGLTIT